MKKKFVLFCNYCFLLVSIVFPISIVSCSSSGVFSKSDNKKDVIRLGLRAEDYSAWKPIIKSFENKYEEISRNNYHIPAYKIKFIAISNQKASYATGVIPDIASADPGVAEQARKKGNNYFQSIDPIEFLGTEKNDKYKLFDDQMGISFLNDGSKKSSGFFESSFIPYFDLKSRNYNNKLVGLPYQYGPGVLYYNRNFVDENKTIKIYVPNFDSNASNAIMIKDTGWKATYENIKKFIMESGSSDENINTFLNIENPTTSSTPFQLKLWGKGYGPGNFYQRVASLGLSVLKDNSNAFGWSKDLAFPFEIVASATKNIYKNGQIDDDELKKTYQENGRIGKKDEEEITLPNGASLQKTLYNLYRWYFGYFKKDSGYAIEPKTLGLPGEAEVIWKQKAAFLIGKKWSGPLIKKNWEGNKKNVDEVLASVPIPYASANMDGLAIKKDVSGEKLIAIKRFIKLALSMHKDSNGDPFAYLITRDIDNRPNDKLAFKAIPTVVKASKYISEQLSQKIDDDLKREWFNAPFGMGKSIDGSPSSAYNNVHGFFYNSSTKGLYQIMSDNISPTLENWQSLNDKYFTIGDANNQLKKGIEKAWKEIKINE